MLRGMQIGRERQSGPLADVPSSARADDIVTAVQPLLTLAIALMCLITVHPLGLIGTAFTAPFYC